MDEYEDDDEIANADDKRKVETEQSESEFEENSDAEDILTTKNIDRKKQRII